MIIILGSYVAVLVLALCLYIKQRQKIVENENFVKIFTNFNKCL